MLNEMRGRLEVHATGVACGCREAHFLGHVRVGGFVLDSSGSSVGWLPVSFPTRRKIDVAVQGAFVWILLVLEGVIVVGQKTLCRGNIDLALILGHELLPALMTGVVARAHVMRIEVGFFADEFLVDGKIRTDEITVTL